jgi:hypothetical protein
MDFQGRTFQDCNPGIAILAVVGMIGFFHAFNLYPGTLCVSMQVDWAAML